MEGCAEGNGESDPHIISLMGSSDLNLVDTSMLPSDPRAMMDLVQGTEHDEDSLSAAFQNSFHQHANMEQQQQQSYTNNDHHLPSSIPCSVSLSSPSPSVVPLIRPSPPGHLESSPTSSGGTGGSTSVLHSSPPLNNHPLAPQQHRLHTSLPLIHIGITCPALSSQEIASSSTENAVVSDAGAVNSRGSSASSLHQAMPLTIHASSIHHQQPPDFTSYYPSQSSVSISRNYPGNGYASAGVFPTFSSSHHTPQQATVSLSPNQQQQLFSAKRDRLRNVYIVPHNLKQEPDEDFSDMVAESSIKRALPHDPLGLDQPPYLSFANLNLNNERGGLLGCGLRANQRNPSGGDGNLIHPPLISPIRTPSSTDIACTSPNEGAMAPRVQPHQQHQAFSLSSPPPQMVLESVLNNGRVHHTISGHLQQQQHPQQQQHQQQQQQQQQQQHPQHQTHLFQPIQLHSTTMNPLQHGGHLHQQEIPLSLASSQPISLSLSAYEDSLNNEPLASATRNLSFNYSDVLATQSGSNMVGTAFQESLQYGMKGAVKNPSRRSSGSSCRRKEEEDQLDSYSTDSGSMNESDDDTLVIDTSTDGYECGECKHTCRTRGGLRKHLATEHLSNEPEPAETIFKKYVCPVTMCSFVTTHRDEMDKHICGHLDEGWTPTGKKRHNKQPLQRHRYNKEEFQCPHCEYSCTVEKAFNRHLAAHVTCEDEVQITDKVSCQICGKDRPTDAALRLHMKRHRKGKYYKCDICKFKSVQLKKLIQHRRMHTGEKPHLCPYCVYRAARRDNLRSHVRRMHKKNNMFCDTFTPRPLIVAQVEANQGSIQQRQHHPLSQQPPQQQVQHQEQHRLLGQHTSSVQIQPLMERPQQHHHPQGLGGLGPQGLGVGAMSPPQEPPTMQEHIHLGPSGLLILPSASDQHNLLPSSPTQ